MPLRRAFAVCLAIFALYMQLAAAGLCAASLMAAPADAAGAFPICHSSADAADNSSSQNDHQQPAHQHECPFCAVHCHAAMAVPHVIETLAARALIYVFLVLPPQPTVLSARFPASPPARGPPLAI